MLFETLLSDLVDVVSETEDPWPTDSSVDYTKAYIGGFGCSWDSSDDRTAVWFWLQTNDSSADEENRDAFLEMNECPNADVRYGCCCGSGSSILELQPTNGIHYAVVCQREIHMTSEFVVGSLATGSILAFTFLITAIFEIVTIMACCVQCCGKFREKMKDESCGVALGCFLCCNWDEPKEAVWIYVPFGIHILQFLLLFLVWGVFLLFPLAHSVRGLVLMILEFLFILVEVFVSRKTLSVDFSWVDLVLSLIGEFENVVLLVVAYISTMIAVSDILIDVLLFSPLFFLLGNAIAQLCVALLENFWTNNGSEEEDGPFDCEITPCCLCFGTATFSGMTGLVFVGHVLCGVVAVGFGIVMLSNTDWISSTFLDITTIFSSLTIFLGMSTGTLLRMLIPLIVLQKKKAGRDKKEIDNWQRIQTATAIQFFMSPCILIIPGIIRVLMEGAKVGGNFGPVGLNMRMIEVYMMAFTPLLPSCLLFLNCFCSKLECCEGDEMAWD